MCTITLGWKILIMVVIVVYSLTMMSGGSAIAEWKKKNDDEMMRFAYKASLFIIAVVCTIVWLLLS